MPDSNFFQNTGPYSIKDIAEAVDAEFDGDHGGFLIKDVAPIDGAEKGDITFLANPKYKDQVKETNASAIIIGHDVHVDLSEGCAAIKCKNPYKAYALIAQKFYPESIFPKMQIHPSAVIEDSANIGESCHIGANVYIGENVKIGDGCYIGANAVISHAHLGQQCRIFPGVKIGQDGFGFAMDPAGHVTVPQLGRVIIEDYVEIGANSTIDRGAGPDTIIGAGTRIDNLVQIGHNVKIGKNCVIVAQAGVSGSTVIEDYAVLAAQSGVAGHITIGKGAQVGAKAGLDRDVPAGDKVMGYPAKNMRDFWAEQVILKKLMTERKSKLKGKNE